MTTTIPGSALTVDVVDTFQRSEGGLVYTIVSVSIHGVFKQTAVASGYCSAIDIEYGGRTYDETAMEALEDDPEQASLSEILSMIYAVAEQADTDLRGM